MIRLTALYFTLSCFINISISFAAGNYAVIKKQVNVRADSTITSQSLGLLEPGERVKIIQEKYDWYKIILPRRFPCYAASQFIKPVSENTVAVTANVLNLRNNPSPDASIIGKVKNGTILSLISQQDKWIKVNGYPHAQGWINKNFAEKVISESSLPVTTQPVPAKTE